MFRPHNSKAVNWFLRDTHDRNVRNDFRVLVNPVLSRKIWFHETTLTIELIKHTSFKNLNLILTKWRSTLVKYPVIQSQRDPWTICSRPITPDRYLITLATGQMGSVNIIPTSYIPYPRNMPGRLTYWSIFHVITYQTETKPVHIVLLIRCSAPTGWSTKQ